MKKSQTIFAIIVLLVGTAIFNFFNSKYHPNTIKSLGSGHSVILQRDLTGHYRAEALINGVKTNVLVDTGATDVSISQEFAKRLGIYSVSAARMTTANGYAVGYLTRLKSVQLGGIIVNDVAATISPNLPGDALLGMAFLNSMDVHLVNGTMTISEIR
jgi:aspartyl protease family protein